MDTESLPRIAVIGAGPIGIEAALYARYLGYEVIVLECGDVADSVRRWGHVRMFSPFRMNRSPLGLAAIAAQDDTYSPPSVTAMLTGHEWAEQYLLPLSRTDLLGDCIHTQTRVSAISRVDRLKVDQEQEDAQHHGGSAFRILAENPEGAQRDIERTW